MIVLSSDSKKPLEIEGFRKEQNMNTLARIILVKGQILRSEKLKLDPEMIKKRNELVQEAVKKSNLSQR